MQRESASVSFAKAVLSDKTHLAFRPLGHISHFISRFIKSWGKFMFGWGNWLFLHSSQNRSIWSSYWRT